MDFLAGRLTFARHKLDKRGPKQFGPDQLEKLAAHAIGRARIRSGDGLEIGWTAGDHILDTRFDLAKNIVNDTLQFALRVDQQKIPADLLRAYTLVELEAMAKGNPSGLPSSRQKREARGTARDRLEQEAADGRYLKRKAYPILWDALTHEILIGTTAASAVDHAYQLFQQTFGNTFAPLGAGKRAYLLAQPRQQTRSVDDAGPAAFVPGVSPSALAWLPDEASRDFLGNEFLLWLWFTLDADSDTIKLADDSEVAVMLARSLTLECPRGQTGKETITSDGPTRLPEARRAIQAGKLPRKAGFTLVRHDHQYEFSLQGETLAVSGLKLPTPETEDEHARLDERVNLLRHFLETLDLLYDVFAQVRSGDRWAKELARMQKWLQREDKSQLAAIG
jgi:hypothetical protein